MDKNSGEDRLDALPACATEYIRRVVAAVRYRKRVRREVRAELTAHFEDALREAVTDEQRQRRARELIERFGDPKLVAVLCRRAKKRCRPLWRKVLVRSMQGMGVVALYLLLCSLPLFLGRPTIRVNYVDWLSDRWRPVAQGAENAKSFYNRAAAAYVEPPEAIKGRVNTADAKPSDFNEVEVQLLDAWLAENAAAFELLRRGANTPDYWPIYDGSESLPFEVIVTSDDMETLKRYRPVLFGLRRKIARLAEQSRIPEAVQDCLVLRRLGRHLQNKGALNGQMMGISIEQMSYNCMLGLVRSPSVAAADLEDLQKALLSSFDAERAVVNLDGEKAFWYDAIQRGFTDDGHGGGRALKEGFLFAAGDWKSNLARTLLFDYPDRREATKMVEQYFARAQTKLSIPPNAALFVGPNGSSESPPENLFLALLAPAHERLGRQVWAVKTHELAALTILALLRYRSDHGSYPESLEHLVENDYLQRLAKDPFGRGTLTYRRTDAGFLLYSWGESLNDDGGRQGTDREGRPRLWQDNGDWVFWPVRRTPDDETPSAGD